MDDGRTRAGTRRILGRAITHGQVLPLGTDDPVIAARAVRRALADARRRAADVNAILVCSPPPLSEEAAARFARRALGPHGSRVRIDVVEADGHDAVDLLELARPTLVGSEPAQGEVGIAVGIDGDGTTLALCLACGSVALESDAGD